jgi:DNA-binding MarR family transcriptional regulator
MKDATYQELASLFFSTRQIIRSRLPESAADPNAWLRFQTMRFIEDNDAPTMQDVAMYLRIKAPSATSLIGHLAGKGCIRRRTNGRDKRVTRLVLTTRGKKVLAEHQKRSNATLRRVFSQFDRTEIRELARILRHLRDVHAASSVQR